MQHFKSEHFDRAEHIALEFAAALKEHDEAIYFYGDREGVNPIETEARDGFIPYTSGGFEVCLPAFLAHHNGTGCAPEPIQPLLDSGNEFIADEWNLTHENTPFDGAICGEFGPNVQEAAWEFESEAWANDSDCYFWKARVMFLAPEDRQNETGKPEVYIDAYLNTDLNYGRDYIPWMRCLGGKSDQTIGSFKRTIPLEDFHSMDDVAIEALVSEAINSLP